MKMKTIIGIITALLLATGADAAVMKMTVLFEEPGAVATGTPVFLDEKQIGKVTAVKKEGNVYGFSIEIGGDFSSKIRENSEFYVFGSEIFHRIQILNAEPKAPELKQGSAVKGEFGYKYFARRTGRGFKKMFDRSVKEIDDFFNSSEWSDFRNYLKGEIGEAKKKGKEGLDKVMPRLKKESKEFVDGIKEKSPETAEKAKKKIKEIDPGLEI
jgi:hypothetical protein